jgi:phage recombination protein Bet
MSKVTALATQHESQNAVGQHFSQKQIDILKNSICKGVSNEEFDVFLMACTKTQLDPFMKQIYAVKRNGANGATMTIQTGIDGYRLIAERTGYYSPGPEPTYAYDAEGKLISATAYIKKQTRDGTWHTISASAYLDEYMQKTRDGRPMGLWSTMTRTMLAKCAESQALRKAFPAEMSGIYTKEEMEQADAPLVPTISLEQTAHLQALLDECDAPFKALMNRSFKKQYGSDNLSDIHASDFERIRYAAVKNIEDNLAKKSKPQDLVELIDLEVK